MEEQNTTRGDEKYAGKGDEKLEGGEDRFGSRGLGRIGAGLVLLSIGAVLLLDQMGFPFPDWLFTWHVLLIAIGLFIGLRHNFRGGAWLILILVGGFFFIQDSFPHIPLHRFIWPIVLIFVGLLIIVRPHNNRPKWRDKHWEDWKQNHKCYKHDLNRDISGAATGDYLDSTTIFGSTHKKVVSKNFRGGDVTGVMGGSEIDLTQADFTGIVKMDVTTIFAGAKIIVPAHWEVRSEITAVFGGFEDKRQQPAVTNPDKILILQGASVFGGIELKNY
ncbi:LiaF transmembrane domain-containing protein [Flavitalea flava]